MIRKMLFMVAIAIIAVGCDQPTTTPLPPHGGGGGGGGGSTSYTLTVNPVGGGTVSIDPAKAYYASGAEVKLTAKPNEGWRFGNWSGSASGNDNPIVITMNGNKVVNAVFRPIPPSEGEGEGEGEGEQPVQAKAELTLTASQQELKLDPGTACPEELFYPNGGKKLSSWDEVAKIGVSPDGYPVRFADFQGQWPVVVNMAVPDLEVTYNTGPLSIKLVAQSKSGDVFVGKMNINPTSH